MAVAKEQAYWNQVYSAGRYVRGEIPHNASPFAQFSLGKLQNCIASQLKSIREDSGKDSENQVVVWEWGCGNGRDALYFARNGLRVVGTDLADVAIKQLNDSHLDDPNLVFISADFTDGSCNPQQLVQKHFGQEMHGGKELEHTPTKDGKFLIGAIYSRFTIHSVREEAAAAAFKWAFEHLHKGGMLTVETRSVKDTLCGVGTQVEGERNAWIEDHYRRFTVASELQAQLEGLGFVIDELVEDQGLAVYKTEDPCVIRVYAIKP